MSTEYNTVFGKFFPSLGQHLASLLSNIIGVSDFRVPNPKEKEYKCGLTYEALYMLLYYLTIDKWLFFNYLHEELILLNLMLVKITVEESESVINFQVELAYRYSLLS